ncbi:hypothetical protein P167DRAFT_187419 [Morchella conica CCBAS932]|uniref:Uncharacterized protein n=1 Tax=Morchella conica CCBAS932 TaxID=1392247 RepID=A0A3N4KMI9_9PEZI|nr:hypothetical protein P167DRAFT_187419 [Morchella conica CCBAS932]
MPVLFVFFSSFHSFIFLFFFYYGWLKVVIQVVMRLWGYKSLVGFFFLHGLLVCSRTEASTVFSRAK